MEVRDETGNVVAGADDRLVRRYGNAPTLTARWKRLPGDVDARDAKAFEELLAATNDGDVKRRHRYNADTPGAPAHPSYLDVYALVTEEEVEHGIQGMGWTFLVRAARQHHPHAQHSEYLVRAVRAGPSDLARRIPELSCLGDRTVIVVGVGGVGSFCALEFARAGVRQLVLVDGDGLEPANSVRWPFGFPAAGEPKASLLARFINDQHPYTEARPVVRTIGALGRKGQPADHLWLEELLASADLALNTTGEPLVNLLLGERAKAFAVPYVMAHTTYGGWGGMVARVLPQHDACIWCLQAHRVDAEGADPGSSRALVLPPSDPAGEIAPPGCSSPTFTGAGFDTARIAQPAVQLAVSTLCRCDEGYPQAEWDIATLSLRDPTGRLLDPRWDTSPLLPHPRCDCSGE
jgi:molybdopterin/thiamine biosynthesis adenylyltransferase